MNDQKRAEIWLKKALKMEQDAKGYYEELAVNSKNSVLKDFFTSLASLASKYTTEMGKVFDNLAKATCWKMADKIIEDKDFVLILSRNMKPSECKDNCDLELITAVNTCLDYIKTSLKFYKEETKNAGCSDEESFLKFLAAEKQGQEQSLLSFKLFMTDPETWMLESDHGGLDGA